MYISNELYKPIIKWMFKNWHTLRIEERRNMQKRFDKFVKISKNAQYAETNIANVPATEIITTEHHNTTIIYFHGGGYVLGGTKNHLNLCASLAQQNNARVILVHYQLAPEAPFPAALNDAIAVYKNEMMENSKRMIFLGGDSAGGGLALSLLSEIRKAELRMPAGVFCFSPWTDLTLSGESVLKNASKDPILTASGLENDAMAYAGMYDMKDPRISPLYCSMEKTPPILIQVGTNEILFDDAKRFYEKAIRESQPVELQIFPDMVHVFQILPYLREAEEAITNVSGFIDRIVVEKRKIPKMENLL